MTSKQNESPAPESAPVFRVGTRVRYKPELRAYYEAPLVNGHAWARWVLDATKPDGVTVTSTAVRDWLHWGDQGGGASTHSMEHVPTEAAPVYSPPPPSGPVGELIAVPQPKVTTIDCVWEEAGAPKTVTCPTCRGPATELLVTVQCHADPCVPWVEPEPEADERWVRSGTTYPLFLNHTEGRERVFVARHEAFDASAVHPVRETAISMWRAMVRR